MAEDNNNQNSLPDDIQGLPHKMATEHQGTKEKFWFGALQNMLFKIGKVPGENWAELISYQLALNIELPAAQYVPSSFTPSGSAVKHGVVSFSVLDKKKGERLINANELLAKTTEYDQFLTYKQRKYTFHLCIALFKLNEFHGIEPYSAIKQFIGYLIFDVLIGNQDRHHENWGFISFEGKLTLAPSFDHGSSLACRLSPEKRRARLDTRDAGYGIAKFASTANSAMYNSSSTKLLKTYELAKLCYTHFPEETAFWVRKMMKIDDLKLREIVDSIPNNLISEIEREFTVELLKVNREYLKSLIENDV